MQAELNQTTSIWGIDITRVEITNIRWPNFPVCVDSPGRKRETGFCVNAETATVKAHI